MAPIQQSSLHLAWLNLHLVLVIPHTSLTWVQVEFDDLPGSSYSSMNREQRLAFWEKTKRLAHGTLVTLLWLAPDGRSSQHMVFGTVSVRDARDLAAGQGRRSRGGVR